MLRSSTGAFASVLASACALAAAPALAAGPPVVVSPAPGADAALVRRVRDVVGSRRAIRDELALPPADAISADQAVMTERAASIRLALGRAHHAETEAAWDACVHEAADALPAAIEVLSKVNDLLLLRDLHAQIGACLTLAGSAASARPHFVSAALLDEAEPRLGLHREEAEKVQAEARAEVLSRGRGTVRIETTPPGAEVWIDGRKAAGLTPLMVDVRLGDHYVTTRRFRFEAHTERAVLQPSGLVRVVLDPAGRGTLRDQLAAVAAGAGAAPSDDELRLARAVWSRAEQVVDVEPRGPASCRVQVLDAITGQALKGAQIARADDDDAVRRAVCEALGETCEIKPHGVPWYVWPIAGAALVGGVVSAVVVVNSNRSYRYCFACK
jgi:PEGA domain